MIFSERLKPGQLEKAQLWPLCFPDEGWCTSQRSLEDSRCLLSHRGIVFLNSRIAIAVFFCFSAGPGQESWTSLKSYPISCCQEAVQQSSMPLPKAQSFHLLLLRAAKKNPESAFCFSRAGKFNRSEKTSGRKE